jgi:hypothetical protein
VVKGGRLIEYLSEWVTMELVSYLPLVTSQYTYICVCARARAYVCVATCSNLNQYSAPHKQTSPNKPSTWLLPPNNPPPPQNWLMLRVKYWLWVGTHIWDSQDTHSHHSPDNGNQDAPWNTGNF